MIHTTAIPRLLIVMALLAAVPASAQHTMHHSGETDARVPELEEFHSVIFRVWHEAWPAKDYALLRELLPEIEKGASAVAEAELPGILREKQEVWNTEVSELQRIVKKYRAAAEENQVKEILNAAEELHTQFETLARTIRPVLPELEDFHSTLYMLYHYYLPEYSLERIRESAQELSEKMDALNEATLPVRFKESSDEFERGRAKLAEAVQALEDAVATGDEKVINEAVEEVHSGYRSLQATCE
jgi:DNA mismatch repair ATPase MutS